MSLTEDLVTRMRELCEQEDLTLWQQGDELVKAALADDEMGKLAQKLQRKSATLRERERISREFPQNRRDRRHAWSVYRVLARIPNDEERQRLLNSRDEWTVEAMELQVRAWIQKQTGGAGSSKPQARYRSGMKVGSVVVKGQLSDDGRLKITIESPVLNDPQVVDLGDEVVISVLVAS